MDFIFATDRAKHKVTPSAALFWPTYLFFCPHPLLVMLPLFRDVVSNSAPSRHHQIPVQPRPCNDAMLKILALHTANAPLDQIRAAILTACPPPPPTTELVLETKGELRSTPYNTIPESLLRDQEDNSTPSCCRVK